MNEVFPEYNGDYSTVKTSTGGNSGIGAIPTSGFGDNQSGIGSAPAPVYGAPPPAINTPPPAYNTGFGDQGNGIPNVPEPITSTSGAGGVGGVGGAIADVTGTPPATHIDQLVPGTTNINDIAGKVKPPPGYTWGVNPINQQVELVDLTPLDKSHPASGWRWIPDDVANPTNGHWVFLPTNDVLDKPYEGIPAAIVPWVRVALNGGINAVPEGAAREWVSFILQQSKTKARNPDTVPFGVGIAPDINTSVPAAPDSTLPTTDTSISATGAAPTMGSMDIPSGGGAMTIENAAQAVPVLHALAAQSPNLFAALSKLDPNTLKWLLDHVNG